MFGPPRPRVHAKRQPKQLTARDARREELARFTEAKKRSPETLSKIWTDPPVKPAQMESESCFSPPTRLNKENQQPQVQGQSKNSFLSAFLKDRCVVPVVATSAAAPLHLPASKKLQESSQAAQNKLTYAARAKSVRCQQGGNEKMMGAGRRSASVTLRPVYPNSSDAEGVAEDLSPTAIESMYSFDLVKVEELIKTEAASEMEEMYSFDLAKVQQASADNPEATPEIPEPPVSGALSGVASAEEQPMPEMSIRSRRKSAPCPADSPPPMDESEAPWHGPGRQKWHDAGLMQLAAENRELKQRMAQLERAACS